jgi:hypothetical protein
VRFGSGMCSRHGASKEPFAFAGIWDAWKDPASGVWLQSFSMILTDPNEAIEPFHDRMAILSYEICTPSARSSTRTVTRLFGRGYHSFGASQNVDNAPDFPPGVVPDSPVDPDFYQVS